MKPRTLALTRYGNLGSSSRLRMMQYLPALEAAGFEVHVQAFIDDETLAARYDRGSYSLSNVIGCYGQRVKAMLKRKAFNLVWIEKEALQWWPLWLEKLLLSNIPYVLDFDDAVFHHYDQHRVSLVRKLYGKRIDGLMVQAALVVCGNDYLAERAKHAGAPRVEVLPTVIDLDRYPVQIQRAESALPRIVWIGSPSTVKYLDLLREPLQALTRTTPFIFRTIGGEFHVDGVQTECLPWTEATEVSDIMACDVGVMPLEDTAWERGKCGYKLIQYMACGLSVVASPVGVNPNIVSNGVNGLLASSPAEWLESFKHLLSETQARQNMGQAGRLQVEHEYSLQVTAPKLEGWLKGIAASTP
jgi:glycosyltransferase involved in cell wall biosynthesis